MNRSPVAPIDNRLYRKLAVCEPVRTCHRIMVPMHARREPALSLSFPGKVASLKQPVGALEPSRRAGPVRPTLLGSWPQGTCCLVLLLGALLPSSSLAIHPTLQLLPHQSPLSVFGGRDRTFSVLWHNPTDQPISLPVRTRLYQASSATAAPWSEAPWKQLEVLPKQTILESAILSLPAVKAETRFLLQFLTLTNTVIGLTEILVYPTDLLKGLNPLAAGEPIGLWDPDNQLKPLLKAVGAEFVDLETTGLESFRGKLALIGPFRSAAQQPQALARSLKALAGRGPAVVWLLPPPQGQEALTPSFYTLSVGTSRILVAQASLVADLAHNPRAQLHLLQLARQALQPQPARLPHLATTTTNGHE